MNYRQTVLLFVCLLLAVAIPSSAFAQGVSSMPPRPGGIEKQKGAGFIGTTSNAGNKYVRVFMGTTDGRFTIGTADGRRLLYGFPSEGSTSWTTIRVDSTYYNTRNTTTTGYVYGATGFGAGTASIDPSDSSLVMKWSLPNSIDVTQRLTPVIGDSSGAIWIQYTIKNNDTKSHGVGALLMFDTQVNTNDAALLQTSTTGVVQRDTVFVAPGIPSYWQAFEGTPAAPGLVSRATLTGPGVVTPDKLAIGSWGYFSGVLWDYTRTGSGYGDSAVLMQWALRTLASGASVTIATMYGTGSVSVSQGILSMNLAGPSSLSVVGTALSPNPFDIILNVQNTGTATANNVTATLSLPSGLTLASGTATKTVSPSSLAQNASGVVTWSVQAANASKAAGDTLQYTVATTATGLQTYSLSRKVFIPYIQTGSTMNLIYNQIDASAFPVIKSYVSANTLAGVSITGLTTSNFAVKEDGVSQTPITVTPVGTGGSSISVMLTIDKSGSMAGQPLTDARTAATTFTSLLQTGDKAGVISFDDVITVVQGFTSDKTVLANAINSIVSGNSTAIYDALYESVNQTRLQSGRKAIILMTDGIDNASTHALSAAIAYANQYSIPVFTIGLGITSGSSGESVLQQIATQTGGAYYAAPTSADLSRIYQSISQQLANQYLITYTTSNSARNGTVRTVNITVNYNSLTDNKSKQYTAPNTATVASIAPTGSTTATIGVPFYIDVKVGDPTAVSDLYSLVFKLSASSAYCSYVNGSAIAGTYLGSGPVIAFQMVDAQTVSGGITKAATPGVSGSGVVARAQFLVPTTITSSFVVTFSLYDVSGTNSSGGPIQFSPTTFSVTVSPGTSGGNAQVWPGDCDNNGVTNASDILPLGIYYGQSRPGANSPGNQWSAYTRAYWVAEPPGKLVYADADGSGTIDAADLLPIGLNYGKTHTVTTNSIEQPSVAAAGDRQVDGSLQLGAITRGTSPMRVLVPVLLRTTKPLYGLAFTLKYGAGSDAVHFVSAETGGSVLTDPLILSNGLDKEGAAQVGITQTHGSGFSGSGQVMTISLDVADRSTGSFSLDIVEVKANDAAGNPLVISGGSYKGVMTSAPTESQVPTQYRLSQNYPNPFNPSTTISYSVPEEARVRLAIFDLLGREVKSLADAMRSPGTYSVVWDGKNSEGRTVESGVYFYRMTATSVSGKSTTDTQRMILMK
ncbi:MAG TPA: VWA domain-containing protein [Bacteroidota bacterium]|nr:VWA domain-containing protein [Bacteroidota bacterium]